MHKWNLTGEGTGTLLGWPGREVGKGGTVRTVRDDKNESARRSCIHDEQRSTKRKIEWIARTRVDSPSGSLG